ALPITCATWFELYALCIWDGGFLPTEAEWNYAAAGGNEQRAYPWSSPSSSLTIDETYASYSVALGTECYGDGIAGCAVTDLVLVGGKSGGDGKWTHADM